MPSCVLEGASWPNIVACKEVEYLQQLQQKRLLKHFQVTSGC